MKTINQLILAACAGTALAPLTVFGQSFDVRNKGFLVDNHAGAIVRSGFGLCWHDGVSTPQDNSEQCDPTPRPMAAAPAPAVVAAAPAMIAPPAPPKPMSYKMSFSGDALFAFDKSELKPEGKVMLDELVKKLDGATTESITATGHTDRFGSQSYNQSLSERRAQSVKAYLTERNVQANRIDAEGKGKTEPVTATADCRGPKSAKVIACLQPDRRVDVEMTGTTPLIGSR